MKVAFSWVSAMVWVLSSACSGGEWSGFLGPELRIFPHPAPTSEQDHSFNWSFAAQPEYYHEWDNGQQSVTFESFFRVDQNDRERTHFDIRDLSWQKVAEQWELRIGLRRIFWGVTETQHLVDIINQTDLIENIDTEDKLGQPMINLALISHWGTWDFFVLPGFRERTFPGAGGRIRTQPRIDTDNATYQSASEQGHVDYAVRWSHVLGDFDVGVSHFYGTSREPRLFLSTHANGIARLIPHYDIIHQTGLDLQFTRGDWLWKFEAFHRSGQGDGSFIAFAGGFEYTFVGVLGTVVDVGIVAEYLFDDRNNEAFTQFEDDIAVATRLTFNDVQSTQLLAGMIYDRDTSARFFSVEASRRLGDNWKLELEVRAFGNMPTSGVQSAFSNEDSMQFSLARYF